MPIIDIWINCPSLETADAITEALLDQNLIACANLYPPIESAYVWNGSIERAQEHPLLLKTRAELADAVEAAVRALHPYDVPPILRSEITANADYEAWVHAVTRAP
jgi:periplasmic divalent cation tolerance protein